MECSADSDDFTDRRCDDAANVRLRLATDSDEDSRIILGVRR